MRAVELRLHPENGAFPGVDREFKESPDITREKIVNLDFLENRELTVLYHLLAPDETHIEEIVQESSDQILDHEIVEIEEGSFHTYLYLEHTALVGDLLSIAQEHAMILHRPIKFDNDSIIVTLAGNESYASEAFAQLKEVVNASVEWTGQYTPLESTPLAQLTDRQREALRTAYELGFYETPRDASFEELAAELDCAPSTANALLHRSESALVDAVLE